MVYTHLTEGERYQIYALEKQGALQKEIAEQLGRAASTISRELRRNRGQRGYRVKQAQRKARKRRVCNAKRIAPQAWDWAEKKLTERWSPEQIAGRAKRDGRPTISHESIYLRVYADKRTGGVLWKYLRCHKKRRKRYGSGQQRRGHIVDRRPIEERPGIVDEKGRLGDWEGDLVIGAQQRHSLVTVVERSTQYLVLRKITSKAASEVSQAMIEGLSPFRACLHSITLDNGKEFAYFKQVDKALDTTTYFARPYHSWERGLNEQTNGKIRDYYPKRMPFDELTQHDCAQVAEAMNNRPRKSLGYRTPKEELSILAAKEKIALHL